MPVDHEFGDQHTELKLSIVEKYLKFFTIALLVANSMNFGTLMPSQVPVPHCTTRRTRGWSFRCLWNPQELNDDADQLKLRSTQTLHSTFASSTICHSPLSARTAARRIIAGRNDANDALKSLLATNNWHSTRAVLFDPYGMQLEWSTLQKVAATKAIDVWFLFPLAGLYRQATRQLADIDEHKRAALTRIFGSDAWQVELFLRVRVEHAGRGGRRAPPRCRFRSLCKGAT